jgi:hypothetical protein
MMYQKDKNVGSFEESRPGDTRLGSVSVRSITDYKITVDI